MKLMIPESNQSINRFYHACQHVMCITFRVEVYLEKVFKKTVKFSIYISPSFASIFIHSETPF